MDPEGLCTARLHRDHCSVVHGSFTKDLARMNRNMKDIMILDNTPNAYMLQPENAVPIKSWNGEPDDTELIELIPLFILLSKVDDCREAIEKFVSANQCDI
jgi:RNA polymerase II subunit A small phosphatase-like protein